MYGIRGVTPMGISYNAGYRVFNGISAVPPTYPLPPILNAPQTRFWRFFVRYNRPLRSDRIRIREAPSSHTRSIHHDENRTLTEVPGADWIDRPLSPRGRR